MSATLLRIDLGSRNMQSIKLPFFYKSCKLIDYITTDGFLALWTTRLYFLRTVESIVFTWWLFVRLAWTCSSYATLNSKHTGTSSTMIRGARRERRLILLSILVSVQSEGKVISVNRFQQAMYISLISQR